MIYTYIEGDRATGKTQKLLERACEFVRAGKRVLWVDGYQVGARSAFLRFQEMTKEDNLLYISSAGVYQSTYYDRVYQPTYHDRRPGFIEFSISASGIQRDCKYQIFLFDNANTHSRAFTETMSREIELCQEAEEVYYVNQLGAQ